jgi:hypothetical protein
MTIDLFGQVVPEAPRPGGLRGPQKPVYELLTLRNLPRCDVCVNGLHITWHDGKTPYVPPRTAKHKRTCGSDVQMLCNEHAQDRREADDHKEIM